jgi:predicted AAA+ superfamily ATPase
MIGTSVPCIPGWVESRYYDRLMQAYPIHPEVFDRLYEDWTTIDGFQRTRGVLKLMAKVIYRLWKEDNKDLFIMPGSLPLHDGSTRIELTCYLPAGWDAVIESDIDGDRAETTELENKEPRFGQIAAARRVARTLFLGSAPASAATKVSIRGLDRARIILGSLQPGQSSSVYSDALNRLADRLHYLNSSGDKAQDATRFWFDTRANLRREMEDRKRRFDDKTEVRGKIAEALKRGAGNATFFDGDTGGNIEGIHDQPDSPAALLCDEVKSVAGCRSLPGAGGGRGPACAWRRLSAGTRGYPPG